MRTYHIEVSALAQNDLTKIVRYIQERLHEPGTARKMYQMIKREILSLDRMPERYPLLDEERCRALGVRKMLIKNYLVLYLVDQDRSRVQIARIIYAGRDLAAQLDEVDWNDI